MSTSTAPTAFGARSVPPVPPACVYCGELVGDNEYDVESRGYFSSHFRCVSPSADGPYFVRSFLDGKPYGASRGRGFRNLTRARAEADYLAGWNSGRWHFVVYGPGLFGPSDESPLGTVRGRLTRPEGGLR